MEALSEVLVLVRPAQDDHGRDLPELRRGERDVVIDEKSALRAGGLHPFRRRKRVRGDVVFRVHEAAAPEIGAKLQAMLEPRRLAIARAEGSDEALVLLELMGIEDLEPVAFPFRRNPDPARDVASRER